MEYNKCIIQICEIPKCSKFWGKSENINSDSEILVGKIDKQTEHYSLN